MSSLLSINSSNFEDEVIKSSIPVLLEFGASWCRPCKTLEPILEELAVEWQGRVKLVTVDVDTDGDLAMQYGVMGVPNLILFVNGEPKEQMVGLQPQRRIMDKVTPYL